MASTAMPSISTSAAYNLHEAIEICTLWDLIIAWSFFIAKLIALNKNHIEGKVI